MAGQPITFLVAMAAILGWGLSGAYFGYGETWLLFINTAGTIVTALMVFLIQNTQNRDTLALQLKLAELILVMEGTENRMALAEELSHEDLEGLKEDLRDRTKKPGRRQT
jgi:low affinity Fe/Cu permease